VKTAARAAVVLLLAASAGCKKTPEPTGGSPSSPSPPQGSASQPLASAAPAAPASPTTTAQLPPVEITWVDPPEWKRSEKANPMRKASYTIPRSGSDAEDGELGVFYFGPGQGGSIDANVDRWVKQFVDLPPDRVTRADREANGLRQHTIEVASGTFNANTMSAGKSAPKPNYALLGAIVQAPSGMYFFKLTGPKATVQASKKTFYALLDSIKAG
jgi:hypothetical protein